MTMSKKDNKEPMNQTKKPGGKGKKPSKKKGGKRNDL